MDVDLRLSDGDAETLHFDVGGSEIAIAGVRFAGEAPTDEPWSGSVRVQRGSLEWRSPMSFSGELSVAMRDTRPLIRLFVERERRAPILRRVLDVRGVTGRLHLEAGPRAVRLDEVRIEGDRLELEARVLVDGRDLSGLLWARLHGVGFAVALEQGEREWKFVNARRWFESRRRASGRR